MLCHPPLCATRPHGRLEFWLCVRRRQALMILGKSIPYQGKVIYPSLHKSGRSPSRFMHGLHALAHWHGVRGPHPLTLSLSPRGWLELSTGGILAPATRDIAVLALERGEYKLAYYYREYDGRPVLDTRGPAFDLIGLIPAHVVLSRHRPARFSMTPSPAVRHATLIVAAAVAAAVGAAADALPGTTVMTARGIQVSHLAVSCVCRV